MTAAPLFCWSEGYLEYDFGAGHPMSPVRLALTMGLIEELGLTADLDVREPRPATDDELAGVHSRQYLAAVRAAAAGRPTPEAGLGDSDTPIFAAIHRSSALIAGGTLTAALAVWGGEARRALNLGGGLHHAMPERASGFCVYNDPAVGIAGVLAAGARRVAYIDLDAHHGDGVERAFWEDDRVLTISVHQHPASLFPGTGYAQDVGAAHARGGSVNVPLPPGTDGVAWYRAVEAVVGPLVAEFRPELIVSQHGCDGHAHDPLTGLDLSVTAQVHAAGLVAELAEEHAGGRWVALGGGGYEVAKVVPRAWAGLTAVVAGREVRGEDPLPPSWLRRVAEATGQSVTGRLLDEPAPQWRPWSGGYDPSDPVDRAVMATRRAVFPWHGLDPQM